MENVTNTIITNFSGILDRNNNSFYSAGCIDEINKIILRCQDFHAQIFNTVSQKFQTAFIIMSVLVLIYIILKSRHYKFMETKIYKTLEHSLEFAIFMTTICAIALLFFT